MIPGGWWQMLESIMGGSEIPRRRGAGKFKKDYKMVYFESVNKDVYNFLELIS